MMMHHELIPVLFSCSDAGFVSTTLRHGDAEALEVLESVWNCLEDMENGGKRPKSWEDCVTWARCEWETLYNNEIRQLLHCFPPDQVNPPAQLVGGGHSHKGGLLRQRDFCIPIEPGKRNCKCHWSP